MDKMLHNPYSSHYHNVAAPSTPYKEEIPNGLCVGKQIMISGVVLPSANSFSFNLEGGGNFILHVNPRINENCVVRNSRFGTWGNEERHGGLPFQRNSQFKIIILVEEDKYRIAVNGQHCFDYQHRVSFDEATTLSVLGDVQIHKIMYSGGYHPDHKSVDRPSLPLFMRFHPKQGTLIQIKGEVPPHSGRFEFDIQDGDSLHPGNIQMHFNPRFDDPYTPSPIVVRTNRHGGNWGGEDRHGGSPFARGQHFNALILVEDSHFKIAVNGVHFTEFQHRSPPDEANHFSISGDVIIHSVTIF